MDSGFGADCRSLRLEKDAFDESLGCRVCGALASVKARFHLWILASSFEYRYNLSEKRLLECWLPARMPEA